MSVWLRPLVVDDAEPLHEAEQWRGEDELMPPPTAPQERPW